MNDYSVAAVRRAVRVLDALMRKPDQTLQEVADHIGLSKATTFRLLYTLVQDDLVVQEDLTKRYRLGSMAISLGQSAIESSSIIDVSRPVMESLHADFNVVITLNIPSKNAVFEALRVPQFGRGEFIPVGTPLPYHACASGHALLAFSDPSLAEYIAAEALEPRASRTPTTPAELDAAIATTRAQGYALVEDTLEEGVTALAAPVYSYRGIVAGAIGSAAPSGALSPEEWNNLARALVVSAQEISAGLGARND